MSRFQVNNVFRKDNETVNIVDVFCSNQTHSVFHGSFQETTIKYLMETNGKILFVVLDASDDMKIDDDSSMLKFVLRETYQALTDNTFVIVAATTKTSLVRIFHGFKSEFDMKRIINLYDEILENNSKTSIYGPLAIAIATMRTMILK